MRGLNVVVVRREWSPLLWSTVGETALGKCFCSNVGNWLNVFVLTWGIQKYPCVCKRTKLLGKGCAREGMWQAHIESSSYFVPLLNTLNRCIDQVYKHCRFLCCFCCLFLTLAIFIVIEFTHFCQEAKPLGWWPVAAALERLNWIVCMGGGII